MVLVLGLMDEVDGLVGAFAEVGGNIFCSLPSGEQLDFLKEVYLGRGLGGGINCEEYCPNARGNRLLCDFCGSMTIDEIKKMYGNVLRGEIPSDVRLVI